MSISSAPMQVFSVVMQGNTIVHADDGLARHPVLRRVWHAGPPIIVSREPSPVATQTVLEIVSREPSPVATQTVLETSPVPTTSSETNPPSWSDLDDGCFRLPFRTTTEERFKIAKDKREKTSQRGSADKKFLPKKRK